MKIFILGGGPAGLAIADALIDNNHFDFVLVEKESSLGGLAKSVEWANWGSHDLGPHKIFSLNKELMHRVRGLIPASQWLTQPKKSRIYLRGHYLPYPPSPFSLLNIFGTIIFVKMVLNFLLSKIRPLFTTVSPKTFSEDLTSRMGATLYEYIFKPIAIKLWGEPSELDVKLSKGRIQTPSITEVLLRLLKLKKTSNFEALEFEYPKGGLQVLWDSIEKKNNGRGKILKSSQVASVEVSKDNRISKILIKSTAGEEQVFELTEHDQVFSSLPITLLAGIMKKEFKLEFKKALGSVVHNDLILIFIAIPTKKLLKDSWIFIPDPEICFHRVSEQSSFDESMTPNTTILCCEVMSRPGRDFSKTSDDEIVGRCLSGLAKMGFEGLNEKILDKKVIKLKQSYPVYKPGYGADMEIILSEFDALKNFKSLGRQGAYNYIGTLDAMDIGYGAVRWLFSNPQRSDESWLAERQRTSYFPVLD